jgi:hypothetical protein|nr:MAG TPA: hypothetical protein [Caudoviricetes sp.]
MKKFGVFIVAFIGVIISAFTFQYGWNAIITTIIPVNEISIWQAFGLDITLSIIFPDYYKEKQDTEGYLMPIITKIVKILIYLFLIWLASLFI